MHSWHHFQCDAMQRGMKQLQACKRPGHIRQMLRACAWKVLNKDKRQSGNCWDLQAFHHTKASWGVGWLAVCRKNDGTLDYSNHRTSTQNYPANSTLFKHLYNAFFFQRLTCKHTYFFGNWFIQGSCDVCNFLMLHVFQMSPVKLHCNQLCQPGGVTHLGRVTLAY